MSVRTIKAQKETSYFCTITNCKWIPLFHYTDFYSKIYDWFNFLRKRGDHIIGYCIKPNHLHCMIYLQQRSPVINEVIGEGKRLMSYSIVARLKKSNATFILMQLQNALSDYEKKKGLKHKVFEDSFDCKECYTYDFIQQKLQYMHYNPVKAGFVEMPELYVHSSARFYLTGEQGACEVTNYKELYRD